jgi:hypothetical protein
MRFDKLICTAFLLAAMLTAVQAGYFLCAATRGAAAKDAPRTAVIADEKNHLVRVLIDGKEIARFDSEGLRVEGFISYSLVDGAAPLGAQEPPNAR